MKKPLNDDFDFRLHDGHKVVLQPTGYIHLYVDGRYWGFYESEERAMQFFQEHIANNEEETRPAT